MRLIDADELERVFIGKHYGVNAIKYFINMQPIIDAMPVKHGRWIKSEKSDFNWECSECGYGLTDNRLTYCYDCGALMDGDENG